MKWSETKGTRLWDTCLFPRSCGSAVVLKNLLSSCCEMYIQLKKLLSKFTKKQWAIKKAQNNGIRKKLREKKQHGFLFKHDLELAYENRCWLEITLLCVRSGLYMTSVLLDPKVDITLSSTYRRLWSADIYRHAISPLRLINGQMMCLKYSISHQLHWIIMKRRAIYWFERVNH